LLRQALDALQEIEGLHAYEILAGFIKAAGSSNPLRNCEGSDQGIPVFDAAEQGAFRRDIFAAA